jgi:exodeoxyribonuclease-3
MKIATYNVNGVNGRLPVLLRWLEQARAGAARRRMPSGIEGPAGEIPPRRYSQGRIRRDLASNGVAILARGTEPLEARRGLPGDPQDLHSRYIEAAVGGLTIGCLYLPNGNPAPGPKFDYKLAWFERLQKYGKTLIASDAPFIMAGDYNVMPDRPGRLCTGALA